MRETSAEAIEFVESPPIIYIPGDRRSIEVRVLPAGEYLVRFSLRGDSRDAYFEQGEVPTNAEGVAEAILRTPTEPVVFTLRASVEGLVSAEVPASWNSFGRGTLRVVPNYTGARTRAIETWVSSVRLGSGERCSDLAGIPPDAALRAEAPFPEAPVLRDVPVGPRLAVMLRAGHFAFGCADVAPILPSATNEVTVTVTDRPIQLAPVDLPVSLSLSSRTEGSEWSEWRRGLSLLATKAIAAMVSDAPSDVTALLDAMAAASADPPAFDAARIEANFDAMLTQSLGAEMAQQGIRRLAGGWMAGGLESLATRPFLIGRLTSDNTQVELPRFEILKVADLAPELAGFADIARATWTADPDDTVHVGATLAWKPSAFLSALASGASLEAAPESSDVPSALAELIGCENVGASLTAATGVTYGACDAECTQRLCEQALRTLWSRVREAYGESTEFELAIAGTALIVDEPRPVGFEGSWVGTSTVEDLELPFDGHAVTDDL